MSMVVLNSNLALVDETTESTRDKSEGYLKLGNPNTDETYGVISYTVYNNRKIHINFIEVSEPYKKQGYTKIMMDHLKRQKHGLDWGVMSVPSNMVDNRIDKKPVRKHTARKSKARRK
jgi:ribosomal protein S18 acetylase RimI-like enzyme